MRSVRRTRLLAVAAAVGLLAALVPAVAGPVFADQTLNTSGTATTSVYTNASTWTATGSSGFNSGSTASSTVIAECANAGWKATVPNSNAQWIWVSDQGQTDNSCDTAANTPWTAPAETVTFSTTVDVPGNPQAADLYVATDNNSIVYVNDAQVTTTSVTSYESATNVDITSYLTTGENTISVAVTNVDNGYGEGTTGNPAGLVASVDIVSNLSSTSMCKDGGWMLWTDPVFSNQGDCVSYVVSHGYDPSNG